MPPRIDSRGPNNQERVARDVKRRARIRKGLEGVIKLSHGGRSGLSNDEKVFFAPGRGGLGVRKGKPLGDYYFDS